MAYEVIALAVVTLIFALIILWETSLGMVSKRDMVGFLDFYYLCI